MAARFGIDVGGTFTDLIYQADDLDEPIVCKVPTTPSDPGVGCIDAIRTGLKAERLETCDYFLHGSTVGLNALLERRGACVGLLTTKGFRDALEIRRGDNPECANLWWKPPSPLVPRHLRQEVIERLYADGTVEIPLDKASVLEAYRALMRHGVQDIAVALINSYINPQHEIEVEQILLEAGYTGEVTLSHRISREAGEYERTSTAVVDAYVRAKMRTYISGLGDKLKRAGFGGAAFVTRSGGGSLTFEESMRRPVETINSGPAGGAAGAAKLAAELGLNRVVTADVGGTSFDTTIISDGAPRMLYEAQVSGFPLQTAWLDVRSIGAGGGSIAYVDSSKGLKVGPQSAGAVPGPASYGRGGKQPTVTDAALLLGMLGTGEFQSGLLLDRSRAAAAFGPISQELSLAVE